MVLRICKRYGQTAHNEVAFNADDFEELCPVCSALRELNDLKIDSNADKQRIIELERKISGAAV
jgi:hypothetical protein